MSALPRPDLPPGPLRDLNDALHELHHRAGWPSLRTLGRKAACSHTTVSAVFSSPRLPAWGTVELLVEAMNGDPAQFHEQWLDASASDKAAEPKVPPVLAGRAEELPLVRRHLEAGAGLLVMTGEAGIGKSRLVTTASRLAAGRTFVATGACLPLSTEVPLLPVVEVLRAVHDVDRGQWLEVALEGSAPYVAASLARLLPELGELATVDDPADDWSRQRLFTAVAAGFGALQAVRPLAVVVEDLHWADTTTLDLLEQLVARPGPVPLVGTWRRNDPDTSEATKDWWVRVQRAASVTVCRLAPLDRDETAAQLRLLAGAEVAGDTVARIHERSAGLPLFTEQLAVQHDPDGELPALLVDVLDRQLSGLGEDATVVSGVLGVADRPLTDAQLCSVTGQNTEQLAAALRELDRRRLLAPRERAAQLGHPLLAEAARRRLLGVHRADLHRRLAVTLGEAAQPSAAEVAEHWQAAGDDEQELVWRLAAATGAGQRHAWSIEGRHWRRALELWPRPALEAGVPSVRLVDAYVRAMDAIQAIDSDAAAELDEEALLLTDELEPLDAAAIWSRAGDHIYLAGDPGRGLRLLERALAVYESAPPSEAHVRTLMRLDGVLRGMGRYDDATATVRRASEVCAALADPGLALVVEMDLAWHEASMGDLEGVLERAWRAWARPVAEPLPRNEIVAASAFTDVLLRAAAPVADVAAVGARGIAAAERWGVDSYAVSLTRSNLATAWLRAGHVAQAAEVIDPVTTTEPDINHWAMHLVRVEVDIVRGQLDAASSRMAAFTGWEFSSTLIRSYVAFTSGCLLLWRGAAREAFDLLLPFLTDAAGTEASQDLGPQSVLLAWAASDIAGGVGAGSVARGRTLQRLQQLLEGFSSDPFDPDSGDRAARAALPSTWRAELTRLSGAHDVSVWREAAASWDALSRPHDAAYCRWRGGQAAFATGSGTVAARLLRRAATDARGHIPLGNAIRQVAARGTEGLPTRR